MAQTGNKVNLECNAIIDAFLSLHKADGYETLSASSLLHSSVPMSFVMSAGLIQIENDLEEIVNTTGGKFAFNQPCFRHFDMKLVGEDPTHLSLFHMSAAFHVGSTDRNNILPRLWHFLVDILKLEKDRLWITYLDDETFGYDSESYNCWKSLGVDESHLIGLNHHHNFWQQGQVGKIASDGKKCGPHTEIYYECTGTNSTTCSEAQKCIGSCDCGRFIEISNSLFIGNYITDNNSLIEADIIFSECVIGIERIAMILQTQENVHSIARFSTWREKLKGLTSSNSSSELDKSINIILDNLSAFVVLDEHGAPPPGRGGRARIMQNLARSAMTRALLQDLDVPLLLHELLSKKHEKSLILLQDEFICFSATLERGKRKLASLINKHQILTESLREQLQQFDGIPYCLTDKFYQQLKLAQFYDASDQLNYSSRNKSDTQR